MSKISKTEVMQFVKFTLFSISAGVIQFTSFILFNEVFHWEYWVSYPVSITLSVIYNFTLNRKFTFKSANNIPIAMLMIAGYYVVFTVCSDLWGDALIKLGWNDYLVLSINMLINFITEFFFQKFVVFRKKKKADVNSAATDSAICVDEACSGGGKSNEKAAGNEIDKTGLR